MKIEKFEATDTAKALRLVRLEQGDDAVILSNKRTPDGIEIIAASDFDDRLYQLIREDLRNAEQPEIVPIEGRDATSNAEINGLKAGLDDLRNLITAELGRSSRKFMPHRDLDSAARFVKLTQIGFADEQAFSLSNAMHADGNDRLTQKNLEDSLSQLLISSRDSVVRSGGVAAFVGPTGVGKTTSIAKLAAQLRLQYGADSVALISADSRRIGAHQQLSRIADLLSIPLFEVHDNADLASTVDMAAEARWTLIDTAGLSLSDPALDSTLCTLRGIKQPMELVLTLAANAQPKYLEWVIEHYKHYDPDAIALTKTDECIELAPALGSLIATEQQLLLVADGQTIPDDLHHATAHLPSIADALLRPTNTAQTSAMTAESTIKENHHVTA